MAVYIRRVGEVADGAVTEIKLANNAVNLAGNKVTGQLPSAKLEDGAVTETKINNLAVTTAKLQDQAVTLAKAQQALKIHHFTGDETETSVTGTSEVDMKLFRIVKSSANTKGMQPQRLHINAEMKVTGASGAQGTIKIYVDEEVSPRITVNTVSGTYEMQEGDADFSDLANGSHDVRVAGLTDNAGATVYNDLIEIFIEK